MKFVLQATSNIVCALWPKICMAAEAASDDRIVWGVNHWCTSVSPEWEKILHGVALHCSDVAKLMPLHAVTAINQGTRYPTPYAKLLCKEVYKTSAYEIGTLLANVLIVALQLSEWSHFARQRNRSMQAESDTFSCGTPLTRHWSRFFRVMKCTDFKNMHSSPSHVH